MGLWSKGVDRSLTGERRLQDKIICIFKYKDKDMYLDSYPEVNSNGKWMPLSEFGFIDRGTFYPDLNNELLVKIKLHDMTDVDFINEDLSKLYSNKHLLKKDTVSDCDIIYGTGQTFRLYNTYIMRCDDKEITCRPDWITSDKD